LCYFDERTPPLYATVGEHKATLEALLGPPLNAVPDPAAAASGGDTSGDGGGGPVVWEWVERKNKAMAYPTDFAVIRLEGADGAAFGAAGPPDDRAANSPAPGAGANTAAGISCEELKVGLDTTFSPTALLFCSAQNTFN
jgi:hypothetical protein